MSPTVLSLIVLLPLFGALIIGLLGFLNKEFRKQEQLIGAIGTLMVAIPFVLVLLTFLNYDGTPQKFGLLFGEPLGWMAGGNLDIGFTYVLDNLSLIMALVVTGVGTLIHIYSAGYMHGDRGYYKFFMYLNLFIFAMLNLILGSNLVVLFLGWEGVGACSYFLIGFWYEDMKNAKAAQKAFVANRIGDFAMLVAMFILFQATGTLEIAGIQAGLGALSSTQITVVALLIFIAATGKSAQIPLYVWLPDAMAGPTPVSALIHAATMVTSGIYLIARMSGLFIQAPEIMIVVSVGGAATAIFAALMALAQNDIKKVLAYSTVSQLGFMFMALGAGAFSTAIFHVMTHAFFKACLFLGSGSVIHAMEHMHTVDDPQDIRTMGGLRKYLPSTHMTFLISTLAIAGIPLLSGFFSKDEIMGKVFAAGSISWMYYFVWFIGMATAFLTAFYMTRVYFLTFRGKERFPSEKHPHESPASMTIPLWVLSILAIFGGYIGLPEVFVGEEGHLFNHFVAGETFDPSSFSGGEHGHGDHAVHMLFTDGTVTNRVIHPSHTTEYFLIGFSILIAFLGVYLAWNLFTKHDLAGDNKLRKLLGGFYQRMQDKFYVDEFYEKAFIKPFVQAGEEGVMSFDKNIIDGFVNGLGRSILWVGNGLKQMQTGLVGNYALLFVIGVVLIMSFLLF